MNKYIPSLVSVLVLLISSAEADPMPTVRRNAWSAPSMTARSSASYQRHHRRGESAATVLEINETGSVDLILSTHSDLGAVAFNVVDTRGTRYGEHHPRQERISIDVEEGTDLIVHRESEQATNAYTPWRVAIATTRALDDTNEFNLLTGE